MNKIHNLLKPKIYIPLLIVDGILLLSSFTCLIVTLLISFVKTAYLISIICGIAAIILATFLWMFANQKRARIVSIIGIVASCVVVVISFTINFSKSYFEKKDKDYYIEGEQYIVNKLKNNAPNTFVNKSDLYLFVDEMPSNIKKAKICSSELKNKIKNIQCEKIDFPSSNFDNIQYVLIEHIDISHPYDTAYTSYLFIKENGEIYIKIDWDANMFDISYEYYFAYDASEFEEIYQLAKGE